MREKISVFDVPVERSVVMIMNMWSECQQEQRNNRFCKGPLVKTAHGFFV